MRINRNQHTLNFPTDFIPNSDTLTMGEFFAGGGGWTSGCEAVPNIQTKWILNHDAVAIKTNKFNHQNVKVYWADVYVQDEHELEYVDHVHASLECTQHSIANGGKCKKIGSYTMGWEFVRYVRFLMPNSISIENVKEFKKWGPTDENGKPIKSKQGEEFERWKKTIMDLGYEYIESIRNAADDGLPTRRERYFAFFYKPGMNISFPEPTHDEFERDGKKKWLACKNYIDLNDHGNSIFGREFNESLPKHQRKPLSENSLKRIAAGVKKFSPDITHFIATYYGQQQSEFRGQSIEKPIATITTANRHQLIQIEKMKFITDHCHVDYIDTVDKPLRTQTTRQTKQIATVETNFLCSYYKTIQVQSIEKPIATIPTKDRHQLITIEKLQFISKYFNSNGNPGANVESIEKPLSAVMTEQKHQLITMLENFDIKARFLRPDELARCTTFKEGYFDQPGLKLSAKSAVKLIGNAVPPLWTTVLMSHNLNAMLKFKSNNELKAS